MRFVTDVGEGLHNFPECYQRRIKGDEDFFFGKIDSGRKDGGVDPAYIFQEPQATAAVDLWKIESNMGLAAVGILDQFLSYIRIVQESILVFTHI